MTWSDGAVKGVARPEAGYEVRFASNGPDEVVVYFWKQGRVSEVRAWFQNGNLTSKVIEYECTARWECKER